MAVRYPDHWLRTRRQGVWQNILLLLVLLPLALWRATTLPTALGLAIVLLTAAPFVIAYQAWRFLQQQERVHDEPTRSMVFVFRFLVTTPLALGMLMFVLLVNLQ